MSGGLWQGGKYVLQSTIEERQRCAEGTIRELLAERGRLLKSLRELVEAMYDYGMEVDASPPYKHRSMMERAEGLLQEAKNDPA